jgi:cation:H+ antiporter
VLVWVGLVVVGLALLTVAADQLVVGAGRLAVRLRVAPVVVGVVVIGLGTSAPEFLVSGLASAHNDAGLAVGTIAGSNILNLTLILGVAALVAPVRVDSSVLRREAPLTVAAIAVFAVATWVGLGRLTGAVLAVVLVAASVLLVWLSGRREDGRLSGEVASYLDGRQHRLARESLRAGLGLAGVLGGAQLLVVNAVHVAARLGVSQAVIGFTLVALGTSLPELVTAVQAQRRNEPDLVVGNLLGSDLFNSLAGGAVIGLASARPAAVVSAWLLVVMVAVGGLAWLLLYRGHRVSRIEGVVLLVTYLATLTLLR